MARGRAILILMMMPELRAQSQLLICLRLRAAALCLCFAARAPVPAQAPFAPPTTPPPLSAVLLASGLALDERRGTAFCLAVLLAALLAPANRPPAPTIVAAAASAWAPMPALAAAVPTTLCLGPCLVAAAASSLASARACPRSSVTISRSAACEVGGGDASEQHGVRISQGRMNECPAKPRKTTSVR